MGHVRRLVAFDLDGTLVDSQRDLADSANQLVSERGGTVLSEDAIGRMVGEGAATLVRRVLDAAGLAPEQAGALPRFLEIYETRLLNHTTVYPGMRDVVIAARRGARVTLLTNKPQAPTERLLDALDLRGLFDDVVGGDGPHGRKPDPAGLLNMMASAGTDPARTLLVGDSAIDHETARRASARCCLVSFGFGYRNFDPARLTGDEWIAPDASDLARIIEQFLA